MELTFTWDESRARLKREPEGPGVGTREERRHYAGLVRDVQSADASLRDVARYQLAELAYEHREWYQPCDSLVGIALQPLWMTNADKDTFQQVRQGLRMVSAAAGNQMQLRKLLTDDEGAQRAVVFTSYVERLSAVEAYNAGCLAPLLMAHAVFEELHPEGDHNRIRLLRLQMREQYGIERPALTTADRRRQAEAATKRREWLSPAWRQVWARP